MKNINKNTIMILAVILILVALGGGFFAGMQYQKSQLRSLAINGQFADRGFGNGQGAFQRGMGGQRFTPLRGEVLSIGTGTMTVKQQDGTTKIVVIPSCTQVAHTLLLSCSFAKKFVTKVSLVYWRAAIGWYPGIGSRPK